MASEWEKIIEQLEKQMWMDISETVIDHAQNPRNLGRIEDADGFGGLKGQCGDAMQIWLKVKEGIITEIAFWTSGCGATLASGSMVTELAKGKSIDEALNITPLSVLDKLGGLPDESVHCAFLAVNTLHDAIKNYQQRKT